VLAFPSTAQADVMPFGKLDCAPQQGVRFCQGSIATRVPSFDGVPLDVNVTLPPTGDSAYPLVVQLHGWGGSKGGLSQSKEWAEDGYAVLNYTARGFGGSCGSAASRAADPQGCAQGWIHLADSRYEVRDSQYLAGLLADEGLVKPRQIGVTGPSYGGGQSLMLATLRGRVRLLDGSLEPWRSPQRHLTMRIAAAAPIIPWSDLAYSLLPNGRTLDYAVTSETDDLSPVGVAKQSYTSILYALGLAAGYYAPPGADPSADLTTWFSVVQAGEPYDEGTVRPIQEEITRNHYAYYLNAGRKPAPILIANGFTDDLFPVNEAIRYANRHPRAKIAQLHFDFGHPRGQNKAADTAYLSMRVHEWFDRYVGGKGAKTLKGVEVMTQTCPSSAASGGPFNARSWKALHPGEVRFSDSQTKTIVSSSDTLGPSVDPIGGSGACVSVSAADQAGTATYRLPAATGGGYTLAGSPTASSTASERRPTRSSPSSPTGSPEPTRPTTCCRGSTRRWPTPAVTAASSRSARA
jgi:hypothetical protein